MKTNYTIEFKYTIEKIKQISNVPTIKLCILLFKLSNQRVNDVDKYK